MAKSKFSYDRDLNEIEVEFYFSEIVQVVKYGTKLSTHRALVVLQPAFNKIFEEFENYSNDKNLRFQFKINTKTLVVTVIAVTTVGIATYVFGVIPAIGATAALAALIVMSKQMKFLPNLKIRTATAT